MIAIVLALMMAVGPPQLTISWTDNSGGVAWTALERRTGVEGFKLVIQLEPGVNQFVDRNVKRKRTYCYRAFAYTGPDNYSPYSDVVCGVVQ